MLLAANSAYCSTLGYREDELLGRTLREATHPDDIAAGDDRFDELIAGDRAEYMRDTRYLHRDGSIAWVRLRIAATVDPATQARLFIAHVIDIGERKRQEEALAEAEERFSSAFDNPPIGMSLVAPDGRWLKFNRSLCELTGHAETALLLRSFQPITHPGDLEASLAGMAEVLAGRRRTYQMEKRYHHAGGHVIWVRLSASLVRDASGHPRYFHLPNRGHHRTQAARASPQRPRRAASRPRIDGPCHRTQHQTGLGPRDRRTHAPRD
jgi:PAS domain S-box-containing protein